jgi:hypothetical protein
MGFLPGRGSILSIKSLSAVLSAHHGKIVAHVRDGHPRRFELAQGTSVFHPTSVISVHRGEPTMLKVPSWMAQLAAT